MYVMNRKAKIVATIGPASQSEEMLEKLILAGMNVARMNFSHGTHEQHAERIARIRKVSEKTGRIRWNLTGPPGTQNSGRRTSRTHSPVRGRDRHAVCDRDHAARKR